MDANQTCCSIFVAEWDQMKSTYFQLATSAYLCISLIFLMWRSQAHRNTFLTVYLRFLLFVVACGLLSLIYSVLPALRLYKNQDHPWVGWIFVGWAESAELWFIFFGFQSSPQRKHILIALALSITVKSFIMVGQGFLYFEILDVISGDALSSGTMTFICLVVAAFPWQCTPIRPRWGVKVFSSYLALMYGLKTSYLLVSIFNDTQYCLIVVSEILNYQFYAVILYFVVKKDSEYWEGKLNEQFLMQEKSRLKDSSVYQLIGSNSSMDDISINIRSSKKVLDDVRINSNELKYGKKIGQGGFAEVFLAYWNSTQVAVKKISIRSTDMDLFEEDKRKENEHIMDLLAEGLMLKALRHPNIVQFYGIISEEDSFLAIVTEYMQNGSLYNIIKRIRANNYQDKFSLFQVASILADIAKGMEFLHSRNPLIMHRDLKSPNILVDANYRCKVADFGLSRLLDKPDDNHYTQIGTIKWAAPEVIRGNVYDEKCDVYSFGVIVYELLTYEEPYKSMPNTMVVRAITEHKSLLVLPKPDNDYMSAIVSIGKSCLKFKANKRPTFSVIVKVLMNTFGDELNNPFQQLIAKRTSTINAPTTVKGSVQQKQQLNDNSS
eukprot:TRINITY_DN6439_c0_g1_i3.p1 TRINITY_DN6439_c0_g1~~TRINITY_DN6439_c0_g1_i3.p1  ORF type:complete len:607 (-),score=84.71 TRINITY_DN6439_c0_g1_i3:79-1899(-)